MRMCGARIAVAALAILSAAGMARAAGPEVIFCEVVSIPTAAVPGLPGAFFTVLERPYRSPDGQRWIMQATTSLPTIQDQVIIVGSGTTGMVVVQEGVTPITPLELAGPIDRNMGITNGGAFAFATNTDAPTTSDEIIVRYNPVTGLFEVVAREGDPVPGFPGEAFGITIDSAGIIDSGEVYYRATATVGPLPIAEDDFLFLGTTLVAQSGVTVPSGQAGGATAPWEIFDLQDFYMNADGSTVLIQGDLTGATTNDDVLVVNGVVVLQEGSPIPGSGLPDLINTNGIVEPYLSSNGDWMARGNFALTGIDWLVFNGTIIAMTDELIPIGTGERYDDNIFADCFFLMCSNNNGDIVYGCVTTTPTSIATASSSCSATESPPSSSASATPSTSTATESSTTTPSCPSSTTTTASSPTTAGTTSQPTWSTPPTPPSDRPSCASAVHAAPTCRPDLTTAPSRDSPDTACPTASSTTTTSSTTSPSSPPETSPSPT